MTSTVCRPSPIMAPTSPTASAVTDSAPASSTACIAPLSPSGTIPWARAHSRATATSRAPAGAISRIRGTSASAALRSTPAIPPERPSDRETP